MPLKESVINANVNIGSATNSEVVGVKIGTQILVYNMPAAGAALAPLRRARDEMPYRSLKSFSFEDSDLFRGRDSLCRELGDWILLHPVTALLGEPAVGKTSLVQSGLIPLLMNRGETAALSVRDYDAPLADLREQMQGLAKLALPVPKSNSLPGLVAACAERPTLHVVVFLDQFERLLGTPLPHQESLICQLLDILQNAPQLHLVLVVRQDYREALEQLAQRVGRPDLFNNVRAVPPLGWEEARQAIAEPLKVPNEFDRAAIPDDELVTKYILPDLSKIRGIGDDKIDPAPLEIICSYLYDRAQKTARSGQQPAMTIELYRELGQAGGILQRYLTDQRDKLGIRSDADWAAARKLLGKLAEAETLAFYPLDALAAAISRSPADVKHWLGQMESQWLVEIRDDGAAALIGNYMVKEIRKWFPEQYDQDAARRALVQAVADWEEGRLLVERPRLRRIQESHALLHFSPRELALLLRSSVAYESEPRFWVNEIARDRQMPDTLQYLESGQKGDAAANAVAEVLFDASKPDDYASLSQQAIDSPIRNVRISSALALSTFDPRAVKQGLLPFLSGASLRKRWAAIQALAWMRFCGKPLSWQQRMVDLPVALVVIGLGLRAQRIKIASVTASSLVSNSLVGLILGLAHFMVAVYLGESNPLVQFISSLAIGVAIGGIVGAMYGLADAAVGQGRPGSDTRIKSALVRILAVMLGFGLANLFIQGATWGTFSDLRPLVIGAIYGSGFGFGNEWSLRIRAKASPAHILSSAGCLALSAGLVSLLTIGVIILFQVMETEQIALWHFASNLNLSHLAGYRSSVVTWIAYTLANMGLGGIIGVMLVGGLIIGDWLAGQLERARYV